ncbi:hypothetical protein B0H10DRAFT_1966507 [Mycena sp. CBHHK59/15]|nr:hypothetical protein B0H10DRAFT_1966507 [Mycena sp. CBHHK59/15]
MPVRARTSAGKPQRSSALDNNGLQNIASLLKLLPVQFNVSPVFCSSGHRLIKHLKPTSMLGVLACPGGPTIKTCIGRAPPKNIAPNGGLLPNPNSPVKFLTDRFADMGFSIRELMAYAFPTDSETQSATTAPGVFKLNSDVNFSHNATTQKDYNRFVGKQVLNPLLP